MRRVSASCQTCAGPHMRSGTKCNCLFWTVRRGRPCPERDSFPSLSTGVDGRQVALPLWVTCHWHVPSDVSILAEMEISGLPPLAPESPIGTFGICVPWTPRIPSGGSPQAFCHHPCVLDVFTGPPDHSLRSTVSPAGGGRWGRGRGSDGAPPGGRQPAELLVRPPHLRRQPTLPAAVPARAGVGPGRVLHTGDFFEKGGPGGYGSPASQHLFFPRSNSQLGCGLWFFGFWFAIPEPSS